MTDRHLAAVRDLLEPLCALMEVDSYLLRVRDFANGHLILQITADADACAECIVPKPIMRGYVEEAFAGQSLLSLDSIEFIYPGEGATE